MKNKNQIKKEINTNNLLGFSTIEKIGLFMLLTFIIFSPILFSQFSSIFSFEDTGQIGDTVGGITAPFVNLLAAYLIYKSFTAQIQANSQQRNDHRDQMNQLTKEHSFNYISSYFRLINDEYYSNNRTSEVKKSYIGSFYHRIRVLKNDIAYKQLKHYEGQKLTATIKNQIEAFRRTHDVQVDQLNIRLKYIFKVVLGQAQHLRLFTEEVNKAKLDKGIKHFYQVEVEKILEDMDINLLLKEEDSNVELKEMEFIRDTKNVTAYTKIKALAQYFQENGYRIST